MHFVSCRHSYKLYTYIKSYILHTAFRVFFNLLSQESVFMQIRISKVKLQLHINDTITAAQKTTTFLPDLVNFSATYFVFYTCDAFSVPAFLLPCLLQSHLATLILINDNQNNYIDHVISSTMEIRLGICLALLLVCLFPQRISGTLQ